MTPDEYARQRHAQTEYRYRKRRDWLIAQGVDTSLRDPAELIGHVRALYDLGWSTKTLSAWTKGAVSDTTIVNLLTGVHPQIKRSTLALADIPHTVNVPAWLPATSHVPALGAVRRIHALQAIGWTHQRLEDDWRLETTALGRCAYKHTTAAKWWAVDAMFRALCMTPGPSTQARSRARSRRFVPPVAWDDIDDPAERATRGRHTRHNSDEHIDEAAVERRMAGDRTVTLTKAERAEVVARLKERGESASVIEKRHGLNARRDIA